MMKLGTFELIEPLAQGGMGQVWRGRHLRQQIPVAVKLVKGPITAKMKEDFEREVQAHARLSHPGVVYLFDYGLVDAQAAAARGSHLVAGTPYLVLELANRGTLRDLMPLTRWHEVEALITSVLDALAHAHARDVIHRDLKPENILIFEQDAQLRAKLADFGIAHALRDEHEVKLEALATFSGTPYYMPPEQAMGHWREYGPWTDLYALGCIVWELVCGQPPFMGENSLRIVYQHITAPRPALTPQFPVPEGLEAWLLSMIHPTAHMRFRSAAQAAFALASLGDEDARAMPPPVAAPAYERITVTTLGQAAADPTPRIDTPNKDTDDTIRDATVLAATARLVPDELGRADAPSAFEHPSSARAHAEPDTDTDPNPEPEPEPESRPTPPLNGERLIGPRVPFPDTWRQPRPERLADPLVGAGLGLFGLRQIPFVNRDAARDAIWQTLGEVIEHRQMRVVFLVGGPGTGKSSLADWIATRAREVGAARPLVAAHSSKVGPAKLEGMGGMWFRAFRAFGLSRLELYDWLCEQLTHDAPDDERWKGRARALTEWMHPKMPDAPEDQGPSHVFSSPAERYTLAQHLFGKISPQTAALLILDDLQWGPDSLSALEFLLKKADDNAELLVMATVRADILAEDDRLAERIDTLTEDPRCQRIDLGPIDPEAHRELIGRVLHLEADLCEKIAVKTEGNPLFVTQLLRDLIEREQLETGAHGFRLRGDSLDMLPRDIFDLWSGRIGRLVDSYPPERRQDVRWAIELAASLGRQVSGDEWKQVCRQAAVNPPAGLLGRMRTRGLAQNIPSGFQFAHGLLVDSIAHQAQQAGRWAEWNRACARMLRDDPQLSAEVTALRRATYWLAAGDDEHAIDPLIEAGCVALRNGLYDSAEAIFADCATTLDRLQAPACDGRRVLSTIRRGMAFRYLGQRQRAEEFLDIAQRCFEQGFEDPALESLLLLTRNEFLQLAGKVREAIAAARRAFELARQANDPRQALCLLHVALRHRSLGEREEALRLFRQANALAAEFDMPRARFQADLSTLLYELGHTEEAHKYLMLARDGFEEANHQVGLGDVEIEFGERARAEGRLDEAAKHYQLVIEMAEETSRPVCKATVLFNLGAVELSREDFPAAHRWFDQGLQQSRQMKFRFGEFVHICGLLATSAALGLWAAFDAYLAALSGPLADIELVYPDTAHTLSTAGKKAVEAGEAARARGVLQFATKQWSALGDTDECAKIDALLARVGQESS